MSSLASSLKLKCLLASSLKLNMKFLKMNVEYLFELKNIILKTNLQNQGKCNTVNWLPYCADYKSTVSIRQSPFLKKF